MKAVQSVNADDKNDDETLICMNKVSLNHQNWTTTFRVTLHLTI